MLKDGGRRMWAVVASVRTSGGDVELSRCRCLLRVPLFLYRFAVRQKSLSGKPIQHMKASVLLYTHFAFEGGWA